MLHRKQQINWLLAVIALAIIVAVRTPNAAAVVIEPGPDTPPEMVGVGVEEQLGAQIPLDLAFRDHHGLPTTLGKYINGERPVLLTLNYSNCPMLCGRQLNDLVRALGEMEWNARDWEEVRRSQRQHRSHRTPPACEANPPAIHGGVRASGVGGRLALPGRRQ